MRRHRTRVLLFLAGFAVGGLVATGGVGNPVIVWGPEGTTRDPALLEVERLIRHHDCWTGEAPPDVGYPGGVVVTHAGETRFHDSPAMVGLALEHVFGEPTEVQRVHAFCR
ncbi:hypothetical protein [Nocardioides coralli]|uniref:hypothetical protein n=1 Tax=Nocardioides coralli TaxID=2872154 RepID=UPI001CA46276|nr:hypothetical protein [Nocardioides coralli]QZY28643.1 hypothetical protein K6T13_14425 [Nocardioides coralli]